MTHTLQKLNSLQGDLRKRATKINSLQDEYMVFLHAKRQLCVLLKTAKIAPGLVSDIDIEKTHISIHELIPKEDDLLKKMNDLHEDQRDQKKEFRKLLKGGIFDIGEELGQNASMTKRMLVSMASKCPGISGGQLRILAAYFMQLAPLSETTAIELFAEVYLETKNYFDELHPGEENNQGINEYLVSIAQKGVSPWPDPAIKKIHPNLAAALKVGFDQKRSDAKSSSSLSSQWGSAWRTSSRTRQRSKMGIDSRHLDILEMNI